MLLRCAITTLAQDLTFKQISLNEVKTTMAKKLMLALLFLTSFSCMSQKEAKRWLGYTDVDKLSDKFDWFRKGYDAYTSNFAYVEKLTLELPAYTFLVFGGVWCSDTQKLLPQFYKIIDETGNPRNRVKLYLLDEKKISPEKLELQYKITRIPVFILLKDGKEVGRITEKTEISIEADLMKLIK